MSQDVYVTGVGMIPFTKPGKNEPYPVMAARAVKAALADAGLIAHDTMRLPLVAATDTERAALRAGLKESNLS